MKGMQQERVKDLGCSFVMNLPHSSHMGGVWERQIRTVRSVLTSILDQSSTRLDSSSLRTFFYEVMATVNSRPLTTEHLNDPLGPEPLTPKSYMDNEIVDHCTSSRRVCEGRSVSSEEMEESTVLVKRVLDQVEKRVFDEFATKTQMEQGQEEH